MTGDGGFTADGVRCCMDCGKSYGVQLCIPCNKKRYKERGEEYPDTSRKKLLPYAEAQKIVKKLGIKGSAEYFRYYKSGKFPEGMPSNPAETYSKKRKILDRRSPLFIGKKVEAT